MLLNTFSSLCKTENPHCSHVRYQDFHPISLIFLLFLIYKLERHWNGISAYFSDSNRVCCTSLHPPSSMKESAIRRLWKSCSTVLYRCANSVLAGKLERHISIFYNIKYGCTILIFKTVRVRIFEYSLIQSTVPCVDFHILPAFNSAYIIHALW